MLRRVPSSTYRLQFNSSFTFQQARAITDYLNTLGISDCYASSYLKAVPGSPHGYDVVNPTELNPEIGSASDYWQWIETLQSRGMGHILDLVPNHMGIAKSANPFWMDVLENGPSSRFARTFDIEWHPVKDELADKVLIPILGDQYGAVLERKELRLDYERGTFVVRHFDEVVPIAPDTYPSILGARLDEWLASNDGAAADIVELQSILTASRNLPSRSSREPEPIATRAREKEVVKRRLDALAEKSATVRSLIDTSLENFNGVDGDRHSFDALDRLLNEQSYRLAHWRVASEEINYRRFFDVNQLAAVRMEDPSVFDEMHRFVFELVRRGAATGLRIDHVDGLYAPGEYLRRLQLACSQPPEDGGANEASPTEPFYIVVEKILGADEALSPDWPIAGTTGYEFCSVVNGLFVNRRNERAIDDIYQRFVRKHRERPTFTDLAYRSKKQVMHETMSGDINSLGHRLNRFSEHSRYFRDFTLYSLISTLKEVIACFPVYRTYVTDRDELSAHDRRYISEAVRCAKRRSPGITTLVFDFVEQMLLKQAPVASAGECEERSTFISKFQQITSPVSAKGIEDTVLYLYNRLLSLNEVGADPTRFGVEPSEVHAWMSDRQRRWPSALSATSTHDAKRGEDVRARLNVLSEIPGAWKTAVTHWRALNRKFKTELGAQLAPDANEEYLLYQTLVAAWPFDMAMADEADWSRFRERIRDYSLKMLREAKVHTSWLNPDAEYERAVQQFVDRLLDRKRAASFLEAFQPFQRRVAEIGIYNSLSQLVIKTMAPGVPDFFQGSDLWDLNLVDPDNRRPVDYDARRAALDTVTDPGCDTAKLLEQRTDGRIKMFVMHRALDVRRQFADLCQGAYEPLATAGGRHDAVFAFARGRFDAAHAIVCVPRLVASVVPDAATPPIGRGLWLDTRIEIPAGAAMATYRHVFTGARIQPEPSDQGTLSIPAGALFETFPVAILVPEQADPRKRVSASGQK